MPFLGTAVNFLAVLIFGILGALIKRGIPKRISDAIIAVMAISVVYIGIEGALEAAPTVPEGSFLSAGLLKILIMMASLTVGTLIGELIDIDGLLHKLGDALEKKLAPKAEGGGHGRFAEGFASCSILFCVGAMAINGSIADAMGEPDILLAKSVIDAVNVFIMATTLGVGCAFSAFTLLIYQGAFALLGFFLSDVVSASVLTYMSVTGSLIIVLIGTNMLGITRVKTANMVPAIFMPLLIAPLVELLI